MRCHTRCGPLIDIVPGVLAETPHQPLALCYSPALYYSIIMYSKHDVQQVNIKLNVSDYRNDKASPGVRVNGCWLI